MNSHCEKKLISAAQFIVAVITLVGISMSSANAAPFGELIVFWDDREDSSSLQIDHGSWQEILSKYVDDQHSSGINRFDYDGVSNEDSDNLDAYLEYLQSIEPRQLNSEEQKAYWINLYNAATVRIVIDQINDISSIRQIRSGFFKPGPWQLDLFRIAQQELSLDDIEHGILRPIWQDNRIHYAVNCASLGCPNLLKTAFTAENTEQLLEQAAHGYVNHSRGVNISDGELILSSIFEWYADDFGADFDELRTHLVGYAEPELAILLQQHDRANYTYDWALNR